MNLIDGLPPDQKRKQELFLSQQLLQDIQHSYSSDSTALQPTLLCTKAFFSKLNQSLKEQEVIQAVELNKLSEYSTSLTSFCELLQTVFQAMKEDEYYTSVRLYLFNILILTNF